MAKFHITDDGPKPCKADRQACPIGGEHFENTKDAQTAYEASQKAIVPPLKKSKTKSISTKELKALDDFRNTQESFNELYIELGDDSHVLDSDLKELEKRYPEAFLETEKEHKEFSKLSTTHEKVLYFEKLEHNLTTDEFIDVVKDDYDMDNLIPKIKNPLQNKKEASAKEIAKDVAPLLASKNTYGYLNSGTIKEFSEENPEAFEKLNKRYFTYRDKNKPIDKENYSRLLNFEAIHVQAENTFKDLDF